MSALEELALRIAYAPHKCANPACDLAIDTDEDTCSQDCAEAFAAWNVEMAEFYDDDHLTETWELL